MLNQDTTYYIIKYRDDLLIFDQKMFNEAIKCLYDTYREKKDRKYLKYARYLLSHITKKVNIDDYNKMNNKYFSIQEGNHIRLKRK